MAELDPDTTHHLRKVLRLKEGASVVLFDNSGAEYEGEIVESKPDRARVRVTRSIRPQVESPVKITLCQSLVKGSGFDRILTLCTEAGVCRFIPLFTSRTVVKINKAEAADRVKRWRKIATEAAAQSGRVRSPRVEMPLDLKELLEKKLDGVKLVLWERGGSGQLKQVIQEADERIESVVLLAGPEGGFEQAEVRQAVEAGYSIWGLGPRTLRAETVGAVAAGILGYALGDMG